MKTFLLLVVLSTKVPTIDNRKIQETTVGETKLPMESSAAADRGRISLISHYPTQETRSGKNKMDEWLEVHVVVVVTDHQFEHHNITFQLCPANKCNNDAQLPSILQVLQRLRE